MSTFSNIDLFNLSESPQKGGHLQPFCFEPKIQFQRFPFHRFSPRNPSRFFHNNLPSERGAIFFFFFLFFSFLFFFLFFFENVSHHHPPPPPPPSRNLDNQKKWQCSVCFRKCSVNEDRYRCASCTNFQSCGRCHRSSPTNTPSTLLSLPNLGFVILVERLLDNMILVFVVMFVMIMIDVVDVLE